MKEENELLAVQSRELGEVLMTETKAEQVSDTDDILHACSSSDSRGHEFFTSEKANVPFMSLTVKDSLFIIRGTG